MKRIVTTLLLLTIFSCLISICFHTTIPTPSSHRHELSTSHCLPEATGHTACPTTLFSSISLESLVVTLLLVSIAIIGNLNFVTFVERLQRHTVTERRYNLAWHWRRQIVTTYTYRQYANLLSAGIIHSKYF